MSKTLWIINGVFIVALFTVMGFAWFDPTLMPVVYLLQIPCIGFMAFRLGLRRKK